MKLLYNIVKALFVIVIYTLAVYGGAMLIYMFFIYKADTSGMKLVKEWEYKGSVYARDEDDRKWKLVKDRYK